MRLAVNDEGHGNLHAAVLRSTGAGAVGALGWWLLAGHVPGALCLALFALGIIVAAVPPRSWRSLATAASLAAMVGGATAVAGLGGLLLAIALGSLGLARDCPAAGRRLAALGTGALALGAGALVCVLGERANILYGVPGLQALAAGTVTGFLGGLGTIGREVTLAPALPRPSVQTRLGGELGLLLERASCAFSEAQDALGPEATEAQTAAADLMSKIERFATGWHELEKELDRTSRTSLAERLTELSSRESAATDDVVRQEYASAGAALAKQVEYLGDIETGRDRAVARLHHHVAVLERLRLAALHHNAIAAGRVGEELGPVVEDLVAAGRDLDCAAEALAEVPLLPAPVA